MEGGNNNKKRPLEKGTDTSKNKIHLKILGQDGSLLHFEVKRKLPLQKLLMKYCEEKKFEYRAMTFLYCGSRVLVRSTPDELQMEDEDVIEAMVHMHGGGMKIWKCFGN